MFNLVWEEKAISDLEKLEIILQKRIVKKIDELSENPFNKDIKHLKNVNAYRFRVGDYRIIFEIQGNKLTILKIGHRKNIYDF